MLNSNIVDSILQNGFVTLAQPIFIVVMPVNNDTYAYGVPTIATKKKHMILATVDARRLLAKMGVVCKIHNTQYT